MPPPSRETLLSNQREECLVLRVTGTVMRGHIPARKVIRRVLFHSLQHFAPVLINQR